MLMDVRISDNAWKVYKKQNQTCKKIVEKKKNWYKRKVKEITYVTTNENIKDQLLGTFPLNFSAN